MATKAKKQVRFYSKEELQFITTYAKSKEPVREEYLADFCHKNNRPVNSVMFKIYEMRKKLGINTSKKIKANLVKDNSVASMSKGEFNIPIKSWSITQHTDGFYFNVKF